MQIFDTGSLEGTLGSFQVHNTQVYGGFVLHIGNGTGVSVGDRVACKVYIYIFNFFFSVLLTFIISP